MGIRTALLFTGEVFFSIVKSLLLGLLTGRRKLVRYLVGPAAVICFIIESLLGLLLAILLAYALWKSKTMPSDNIVVKVGVYLILGTELLTIITEACLMFAKIRDRKHTTAQNAHERGEVMKCISFAAGTVALVLTITFIGLSKKLDLLNHSRTAICIAAICFVANTALMILSYAKPEKVHVRAIANLTYMSLGVGFTLVVQFRSLYSDRGKSFSLDLWVISAVFCSFLSSACTSIGAFGLGNIQENDALEQCHAQLFEIAALGMTGSAVSMAFAVTNGLSARNIFLTVFPQVVAILLPFIFSYVKGALKGFSDPAE